MKKKVPLHLPQSTPSIFSTTMILNQNT
ncbi:hypothetical protein A2U01_0048565, partial [Trifolium medium]|nr:hypothetical protein [Trifolium medium]